MQYDILWFLCTYKHYILYIIVHYILCIVIYALNLYIVFCAFYYLYHILCIVFSVLFSLYFPTLFLTWFGCENHIDNVNLLLCHSLFRFILGRCLEKRSKMKIPVKAKLYSKGSLFSVHASTIYWEKFWKERKPIQQRWDQLFNARYGTFLWCKVYTNIGPSEVRAYTHTNGDINPKKISETPLAPWWRIFVIFFCVC